MLLVYSSTSYQSFKSIREYDEEVIDHCPEDIIKQLVATKSDLTEERLVDLDTGNAEAEDYDCELCEIDATNKE